MHDRVEVTNLRRACNPGERAREPVPSPGSQA
jgi:hypothetical protein